MPQVAVCFPSCNPERAATATERWLAQGYEARIFVETGFAPYPAGAILTIADASPGYFAACNVLARAAIEHGCDVVVCIGDDMDPDPYKLGPEIAAEYMEHFPDGFGVMQPIGSGEPGVDVICGSPWFGRGWVERAYGSLGPLWSGYHQFFGDQELAVVAKRLGVLWQRSDLSQHHHHWLFPGGPQKTDYQKANDRWWKPDEKLYRERAKANFPNSNPLTVSR